MGRKGSKIIFLSIIAAFLGGCSISNERSAGRFLPGDGLPKFNNKIDIAAIPDATPKYERLSVTGNKPYTVFKKHYMPLKTAAGYKKEGIASWYGTKFHGRRTSSGEPYDMYAMSAAHRNLPLPSYARVTNLSNQRTVIVKINDRGPFINPSRRIIDLSYAAAAKLGIIASGTARVRVEAVLPKLSSQIESVNVKTSAIPQNEVIQSKAIAAPAKAKSRLASEAAKDAKKPIEKLRSSLDASYLQMGAFSLRVNAEKMLIRLKRMGVSAYLEQKEGFYKVKSGPYRDADFALQTKLEIDRQLDVEARVVFE